MGPSSLWGHESDEDHPTPHLPFVGRLPGQRGGALWGPGVVDPVRPTKGTGRTGRPTELLEWDLVCLGEVYKKKKRRIILLLSN